MKKILVFLIAVVALQGWAIDVTYDYSDSEAMAALGFTQEELTGYSLKNTVVSDQYASIAHNNFTFVLGYLYLAKPDENGNTSGEAGRVTWNSKVGYLVGKIVVQANAQSTTNRITVLSGSTTLTPMVSGATMTYTLENPVSSFTITMNEAQNMPPIIRKVTVTYEEEGGVDINATNFPDPVFRNYLLQYIDWNHDTKLNPNEQHGIAGFELDSKGITSLKGIEYFPELLHLSARYNQLSEVDLSQNTMLQTLDLEGNQNITSLDLSHNTELTTLMMFLCGLKSLNVSACVKLTSLNCQRNTLTSLDVTHNTALYSLNFAENSVKSIDLTKNKELLYLTCSSNGLTSLNLQYNTKLTQIGCNDNRLTELDFSHQPDFVGNSITNNLIKGAAMDRTIASIRVNTSENQLFQLDVLDQIPGHDEGNELTPSQALALIAKGFIPMIIMTNETGGAKQYAIEINEEHFPDAAFRQLVADECDTNHDGWLQASEMARTSLDVQQKGIASLKGIEYFPRINYLWAAGNQLSTIDLSGNPSITYVDCCVNQIKGVGVDAFIASLPTLPYYDDPALCEGSILAIAPEKAAGFGMDGEGNVFGKPQVEAAKAKGWCVRYFLPAYNAWSPYDGTDYIVFEDSNTEGFCLGHFDNNHDYKLSYAEAAAVTPSQLSVFENYASGNISRFDEFQYFTGVTTLPESCFRMVRGLETITLPKGIKAVSKSAFRDCMDLKRVTLPEGVKSIRDYAFHMMDNGCQLTSINFPSTLDSIGESAFGGCSQLANIDYASQSVKYVGALAFQQCLALKSFPFESVQRIGHNAFLNTGLTEVATSAYHIGRDAFKVPHPITVTLLRDNMTVYGWDEDDDTYDDSQTGLHLPITGDNCLDQTRVQINKYYFHEAYKATNNNRESLHPYITINRYDYIDAVPLSCEVPVVLPQGSKIYVVTGLDFSEDNPKAFSRSMTGNVVPANTGVVVKLPNRELYTDQYWHLTANTSATAVGDFSQNLLKASVGVTALGSPEDAGVKRFSWEGWYTDGEFSYAWAINPDVYWADGCSAYLEIPETEFPSNYSYYYPMDFSITGDVNGDQKVDVGDLNIVINIILGKADASSYPGNANVDGVGDVDVSDVNMIINIILGKQ